VARISHLAAAFHAWSAPHGASYPEFNAHMVAAHPNGLMVSTWPPSLPDQIWTRLYREPIPLVDSWLELPQGPGLGLELDWGYIESHRA
jgi:L-alanine-DL-glutamate epimerase-like enolase superfamily enzyme